MNYKIALIRGDGIGPEVVGEAVKVLEAVGQKFGHSFTYEEVLLGGCATDAVGKSYPDGTAEKCRACDAVLLGAVGGPKWGSDKPAEQRPETALLAIRKDLGLYANLRPAALRPAMADACPLKKETAEKGIDLMMVRELTGGIYFGQRERYDTPDRGVECADRMAYSEQEIERIGRRAFELASLRRKKVSSVDKANVLETSRLWRSVMHRLAEEYPDVQYEDVLVDNCAMQLVKDPGQFDVVVTENMFGDILSDEASMVTGSIGLLPSASIGDTAPGLYEPSPPSAPKRWANSSAVILDENRAAKRLPCFLCLPTSYGILALSCNGEGNKPMKYICALLSVRDIHAAKAFYQELFGLEVAQDYGRNIAFTCGLALQQDFDWLIGVPSMHVRKKPNNMELVFEETDFDGFIEKLDAYPGIERLGGIIEHDWGQRVARFYDPDGHLIEVGEDMGMVIRRFLASGMTMEEVSVKMGASIGDLTKLLNTVPSSEKG